jgi:hypothetical protein
MNIDSLFDGASKGFMGIACITEKQGGGAVACAIW